MNENPHLTDDFFGMITRYLKYQPEILIKCNSIESLLKLAEIGIPVKHIKASCIILCFIYQTIRYIYQSPDFQLTWKVEEIQKMLKEKYAPMFLYKAMLLVKTDPSEEVTENLWQLVNTVISIYKV